MSNQSVTNPNLLNDGFGQNFLMIIYSLFYAEINKLTYIYNAFKKIEHNYDLDPDFIEKKENLINFKSHFKNYDDREKNTIVLSVFQLLSCFEKNIDKFQDSLSLKIVKQIFRENKSNPFDKNFTNVAIHIRRMNKDDKNRVNNKDNTILRGMDVPNEVYFQIIDYFTNQINNLIIHIYSQGDIENFSLFNKYNNVIFHLNESIEDTFTAMVFADILVTAPSALSYTAALISDNTIHYINFCNKPLSHWNIIQNYKSSRIGHEYVIPMLTPVYYNAITEQFDKIV